MNYNEYFKDYIEGEFYKEDIVKYPSLVEIIERGENPVDIVEEMFNKRKELLTALPPFFNVKTLEKTHFFALAVRGCGDWTVMDKIVTKLAKEYNCLVYDTYSDMGSVKIGNNNFTICLNNGVGDGTTITIIDEEGKFPNNFFDFLTRLEGKFNVYEYDCGNKKIIDAKTYKPLVLNSVYLAYGGYGFVLIQNLEPNNI